MRALICWIVIFLIPSAALAADAPAGVLYGTGSVYLDGAQLYNSMPVMTGDVIETKEVGAAHLDMSSSTAVIEPNAIVRFQAAGVSLHRGSVSMAAGKSLSVFARDFQITPVSSAWTQFAVTRSGGIIQIAARKGNYNLRPRCAGRSQGRSPDRSLRCSGLRACTKIGPRRANCVAWSDSDFTLGGRRRRQRGGAGLLGWTLSHNNEPVSPYKP